MQTKFLSYATTNNTTTQNKLYSNNYQQLIKIYFKQNSIPTLEITSSLSIPNKTGIFGFFYTKKHIYKRTFFNVFTPINDTVLTC